MQAKRLLSGDAFAFETITVTNSAVGFTNATFSSTKVPHLRAIVTVEGGIMRYRYDGTNPTATVGHLLGHGDTVILESGVNVDNFRAIRAGGENGTLSVTYEVVYA